MNITHWAGYGKIRAFKEKVVTVDDTKVMTIKVVGNHERSLWRDDKDQVRDWLLKKFDKAVTRSTEILDMTHWYGGNENGEEVCFYQISYSV